LADSEIERVILTAGPEGPIPDITHPRITNLAGRTGFPQLAGLIARADVVIAGSTLAVHLAAALGTGVVLVETTPKSNEQYVLYLPYSVPLRHLVVGPGDVPAEPDAIVQAFRSLRRVGGVETPFESYLIPADQRPLPMRICCEAGLGFDPH
jgi:ADP-heptose:LPS heptosyltransferase